MTYVGKTLLDRDGEEVGEVTDVLSDPVTLDTEMIVVKKGLMRRERLVPISLVVEDEGDLRARSDADTIGDAPSPPGRHTTPTDEERIEVYRHFGLAAPPSGRERLHSGS